MIFNKSPLVNAALGSLGAGCPTRSPRGSGYNARETAKGEGFCMTRRTASRRDPESGARGGTLEPASDILRYERQPLRVFFAPRSVAVIGATDRAGSVGRSVLRNLIATPFGGVVYPVNPARASVLGIKAYRDLAAVPGPVELVVVVTPAATVPGVIGQCAAAGVKGAIVISAGFKETGAGGAELEQQVLERARAARMRIAGPNCLGVMSPPTGLNATFAAGMARPGSVGFISQSGALCRAVLDWSFRENVGFSAFVSVGAMLDVDGGDLMAHLGDDHG